MNAMGYLAAPGAFSEPEQLLAAYFSSSTVGLCILDNQLHFLAVNRALAEMNRIPAEAHLGKTVREVVGELAGKVEPELERVLTTGQPVVNFEVAAVLPTRTEVGHWIEHFFPIKDPAGAVKQIGMVVVEVTQQKKLEESLRSLARHLQREKERLQTLLEVSNALVSNLDVKELFPAISAFLSKVCPHDYASATTYDEASQELRKYALHSALSPALISTEPVVSLQESATGRAFLEKEVKIYSREELKAFHSGLLSRKLEEGIQTLCCLPLITPKGAIGTLNLASTEEQAFMPDDVNLLKHVAAQIAIALENAEAYRKVAELTDKLKKENLYLQDEIRSELNFEEIIGDSPALKRVLAQVQTVAPTDSTVLILGETGTGKELIARAIHRMSRRKDASFVKLNCAAIPTGLLESELFGHEKGAFTGAISQKVGRLELAHNGTLFLDEVGDIPLELQPKLLRVLQDQEFERLGGTRTIRVNIRLIAATNRDLAQSVAAKEFRSDLYYRLHVFPVRLPALHERTKDIPLLVRYFVQKFSRRLKKQIDTIPTETMNALVSWSWPGNVRELENFIERSVILSEGQVLNVPLAELRAAYQNAQPDATLESLEREHILRVLRETGGVISGVHGAAIRLGMKRTTLQSKMQRMGITREDYEN